MKYIAIIISLYISLLSVMPCQDRDDAVWAQTHLTVKQAYVPTFQQNTFIPYPDLIIPALSEQDIAIWQPPQLS